MRGWLGTRTGRRLAALATVSVILGLLPLLVRPGGLHGGGTDPGRPLRPEAGVGPEVGSGVGSRTEAGVAPTGQPAGTGLPVPAVQARAVALRLALERQLATTGGTWGVYVEDLATGARVMINPDRHFAAASTLKVPLVMLLLEESRRGNLSLEEQLTQTPGDFEEGTGLLKSRPAGGRYSLGQLAEYSIRYSDNVATNMIRRRISREALYNYLRELGGHPEFRAGLTHLSPRELALCLRELYLGERLPPEERDRLLDWLQRTVFDHRIRAGIPPDVPVAHKIGTLPHYVHDAGLILAPDHPLVVVAMSQDVPEARADAAIADIARLSYAYLATP